MSQTKIYFLIKISIFLIFIGRAFQHLFWDAPYRSIFWDENLFKSIVENIGNISWQEYATHAKTDHWIQNMIKANGIIYAVAAVATLYIKKDTYKLWRIPISIGGLSLVLLALLSTKEKFYHFAQFFEHSIQFGLPFIFLMIFAEKLTTARLILVLKILIAFTFVSHGLYAFGAYPVPGKFIDMVIAILGFSEDTSISFLYVAGILDFVVAILIFLPRIQKYALWYAAAWGLLTAFARVAANFYVDFPLMSMYQYFHETLYRIPHGLVPIIVLMLQRYGIRKESRVTIFEVASIHS